MGSPVVNPAAAAYFASQSAGDQASIRQSWEDPNRARMNAIVNDPEQLRKLNPMVRNMLLQAYNTQQTNMQNQWHTNANNAGAIPPPPPVPPPTGPAQTTPVAGPAQPATTGTQPYNPANNPNAGVTRPQPGTQGATQPAAPWAGNVAGGASPIATMMTNNTFAKPAKQPFDYEAAKNQYGAAEAKRLEGESR